MADFLDEVEEDLRRENAEKLWTKYSPYLFLGAVLVVAAVGGFRAYDYFETQKAQEAGAKYEKALTLVRDNKSEEAKKALADIVRENNRYQSLARLAQAQEIGKTNPAEGVKAFDAIIADTAIDKTLRDDAAVRAGYLLVDTASQEDMKKRLEPLAIVGAPFKLAARELLGLAAYKAKDFAKAQELLKSITIDSEATSNMKARIDIVLAVLAGQK